MATIAEVSRGLNAVRTVGQAKVAIGEALSALGRAYALPGRTAEVGRALDRARIPLEAWFAEIRGVGDATDYKAEFAARRNLVTRAYVETFASSGDPNVVAPRTASIADELQSGFRELPRDLGKAIGTVATGVGETAGNVLGGLFSGLGPVVLIVLGIVLYVVYVKGRK
jgi:hypothetical protein